MTERHWSADEQAQVAPQARGTSGNVPALLQAHREFLEEVQMVRRSGVCQPRAYQSGVCLPRVVWPLRSAGAALQLQALRPLVL